MMAATEPARTARTWWKPSRRLDEMAVICRECGSLATMDVLYPANTLHHASCRAIRCLACRQGGRPCTICWQRMLWGQLAQLVQLLPDEGHVLQGLDAIADLMTASREADRDHRRLLADEQREAQRDARAAYEDGRQDNQGDRW
jgi:hypothetical protein